MFTNEGVHTQLHTKINEVLFSEISLSVSIVPSTMLLYCCILYEIIYSSSINNSLVTGSPPKGFSKVLEKKSLCQLLYYSMLSWVIFVAKSFLSNLYYLTFMFSPNSHLRSHGRNLHVTVWPWGESRAKCFHLILTSSV